MNLKRAAKLLLPKYQKLILEYKVHLTSRFPEGGKPHPQLHAIIDRQRSGYLQEAEAMLKHSDSLWEIKPSDLEKNEDLPAWNNGFLPGLDIAALYHFVATHNPQQYIEIGSGNSTKVARKAIRDKKLKTKIVSIDPFPRANIDHLADEVIRIPFENYPNIPSLAERLNPGDILFIDNSHRVLPNSDATVTFLELIPILKPGVIIHIHDIYLPYDYPQDMCERFYSEQYMLAAFLLANPDRYEILWPGIFASHDKELSAKVEPLWKHANTKNVERHGGSFWFRAKS